MSFGHAGIDWIDSLLCSHDEILIMPEFSFYRSWKLLQAEVVIDCLSMAKLWARYFNTKMYSTTDIRRFNNKREIDTFERYLFNYLSNNGIDRKSVLCGIHEAFIASKKHSKKFKIVVVHEHASFSFVEIMKDFKDPSVLMIMRDPRAALAGFYRGIEKKYSRNSDVFNYFYNMSTEEWMYSVESYYKYKKQLKCSLYVIKNEDMVCNLTYEMLKLSEWMRVKYSDSLLQSSTFTNDNWTPDSCYLKRGENIAHLKDFYSPENVKARWISELQGIREINLIEQIFWKVMIDFGYEPLSKRTMYNKLYAYYSFVHPHRGKDRFKFYPPNNDELYRKQKILKHNNSLFLFLWNIIPGKGKYIYVYISTILLQIKILFTRNRWSRYDIPFIDEIYRGKKIV
jgi:hypothetical protein